MKVKAKMRFNYGKRVYFPDDDIDMPDKDAKLLAAAGRITIPEPADAPSAKTSRKRAGDAGAAAKRSTKAETSGDARSAKNAPAETNEPPPKDDSAADEAKETKSGKKTSKSGGYKRRDVRATEDRGDDAGDTGE